MYKFVIGCILIFLVSCSTNKVCRNPEGQEVDWYSIFLMPSSASSDRQIHYGYFDSKSTDIKYYKYMESNFPPTQITRYATLGGKDFNYFFWNDDITRKNGDTNGAPSYKAHAKGSLVYDSHSGAFLLHSLPRFPTRSKNNDILTELPSNGGSYGQSFLCLTVDQKNAELIAKILSCTNVSINKSVKEDRVNKTPNIWVKSLIQNRMHFTCPVQSTKRIITKGRKHFLFHSKNFKNKIIPYDTTLRQTYRDDFYVRTWSRPALAQSSISENYKLSNVLNVKFGNFNFGVNKEHSKWAISKNKSVICFSDLNHTKSQKERGGSIVCFDDQRLHKIMKNAITKTD
jgi:deoxyribonuclease-2